MSDDTQDLVARVRELEDALAHERELRGQAEAALAHASAEAARIQADLGRVTIDHCWHWDGRTFLSGIPQFMDTCCRCGVNRVRVGRKPENVYYLGSRVSSSNSESAQVDDDLLTLYAPFDPLAKLAPPPCVSKAVAQERWQAVCAALVLSPDERVALAEQAKRYEAWVEENGVPYGGPGRRVLEELDSLATLEAEIARLRESRADDQPGPDRASDAVHMLEFKALRLQESLWQQERGIAQVG